MESWNLLNKVYGTGFARGVVTHDKRFSLSDLAE